MVRQEEAGPVDPRQLEDERYRLGYMRPQDVEEARLAAIEAVARAEARLVERAARMAQTGSITRARQSVRAKARKEARDHATASGQVVERKLSGIGVVTIPAAMLRALGWHPGDDVRIHMEGKTIIIE